MLACFIQVFLEDAVYLKDRPDLLGLVVKTWHDFESGESDSDDEESTGPVSLSFTIKGNRAIGTQRSNTQTRTEKKKGLDPWSMIWIHRNKVA